MVSAKPAVSIVVTMLGLTACAAAQFHPTDKLTAAACRQATPAETRGLSVEWAPFLPYTNACEVKDDKGKTILVVLAVSATRYYDKLPSGTETVAMPKPLLIAAAGETVGTLPFNFPDDPPFALQVTFAGWADGWPHRIEIFVEDPTVTGNHAIEPLLWEATLRRFVQQVKK